MSARMAWIGTLILAVILLGGSVQTVQAQSAKGALLALKKLEARCQVGISYRDYLPALGEAKLAVNLFEESHGGENGALINILLSLVVDTYGAAGSYWSLKISEDEDAIALKYDMDQVSVFWEDASKTIRVADVFLSAKSKKQNARLSDDQLYNKLMKEGTVPPISELKPRSLGLDKQ